MSPVDERHFTVADIAELLRVNPQTVYNWIDRGQLKAVRAGARRVRVRQSDLDLFLGRSAPGRDTLLRVRP
jgi:excisionase family DNA binding protein